MPSRKILVYGACLLVFAVLVPVEALAQTGSTIEQDRRNRTKITTGIVRQAIREQVRRKFASLPRVPATGPFPRETKEIDLTSPEEQAAGARKRTLTVGSSTFYNMADFELDETIEGERIQAEADLNLVGQAISVVNQFSDMFSAGGIFGYQHTDAEGSGFGSDLSDGDTFSGTASADIDSYSANVFFSWNLPAHFYVAASGGYSHTDIEFSAQGNGDSLSGDFDFPSVTLEGLAGYYNVIGKFGVAADAAYTFTYFDVGTISSDAGDVDAGNGYTGTVSVEAQLEYFASDHVWPFVSVKGERIEVIRPKFDDFGLLDRDAVTFGGGARFRVNDMISGQLVFTTEQFRRLLDSDTIRGDVRIRF